MRILRAVALGTSIAVAASGVGVATAVGDSAAQGMLAPTTGERAVPGAACTGSEFVRWPSGGVVTSRTGSDPVRWWHPDRHGDMTFSTDAAGIGVHAADDAWNGDSGRWVTLHAGE